MVLISKKATDPTLLHNSQKTNPILPMSRQLALTLSVVVIALSGAHDLNAQSFSMMNGRNHPQIEWLTAHTDHFTIIYPKHLAGIEAEAAAIAEATYTSLSLLLNVEFEYRIPIYLSDQDEIVNGFAVPFNREYTQIWVALNEKSVFTGQEKWLRKVLAHELAHIFHFKAIKSNIGLFGTFPAMRRHWTEGFAQYSTEKWDAYRGDALLRTSIFEDRPSFSRGESIKDGGLTYAVGNSQLRYFAHEFGDSTIAKLFAHRDTIAFVRYHNFNKAFKAVTKRTYGEFDADWRRVANIHYNSLAGYMGHLDSLDTAPLSVPGLFITDVKYSPDTTNIAISGYVSTDAPFSRIWIRENRNDTTAKGKKRSNKTRVVYEGPDTGPLAWSPDGSSILFSRSRRGPNGSIIPDVHIVDVAKGKTRRLTTDLRATYSAWSHDGTSVYAAVNDGGTGNIHRIDPITGANTKLTNHVGDVQVGFLRHHPSQPWLAFTRFDANGSRVIVLRNMETGEENTFTNPLNDDRMPIWSPNGDTLAYTSLRDLVPNVFMVPVTDGVTGEEVRVTNQFTGFTAFQWVKGDSLNPSGTLVGRTSDSKMRDQAWRIDSRMRTTLATPVIPEYYSAWIKRERPDMIPYVIAPDASLIRDRNAYQPGKEIDHVFSLPIAYFNSGTDWGFGGATFWREPLGIHEFIGAVSVAPASIEKNSYAALSYLNRSFHATVGADAFHNMYDSRVYSDDLLISQQSGFRVSASLPLDVIEHPFTSSGLRFSSGWIRSKPNADTYELPLQDNLAAPVLGTVVETNAQLTVRRFKPYAGSFLHPLDGMGAQLGLTSVHGDASYTQADAQAFALIPALGPARLYVFGRYSQRFGTGLPQDILGFNRYDDPELGDLGIIAFGNPNTERVRGYRGYVSGESLLFGTAEWRMPLVPDLQTSVLGLVELGRTTMAVFADGGIVGGVTNLPGVSTERRVGAGVELKNELRVFGLSLSQSLGAARPADKLKDDAFTDIYWRIKGSIAF
jgi:Tol biopolymer transport system component